MKNPPSRYSAGWHSAEFGPTTVQHVHRCRRTNARPRSPVRIMAFVLLLATTTTTRIESFAPRIPFQTRTTCPSTNQAVLQPNYVYSSPTTLDRSTTSRRYSDSALDQPPLSSSNFEDRMRKFVSNQPVNDNKPPATRATTTQRPSNVQEVQTLQDYKAVVADETDQLVVVRFYASWCKACRSVTPLFYRMARDYPQVKFVEVPFTDTSGVIHRGLGVPSLPYIHIYHPDAGLVEELRMPHKQVSVVRATLLTYVDGRCDLVATKDDTDDGPVDDRGDETLRP